MGKTIIQTIGPLYGEPVNGTVFGRPNGSIYVPPTNNISIEIPEAYRYLTPVDATYCRTCDSTGTARYGKAYAVSFVAEAQDLSSYIQLQVYSDAECTELVASRNRVAGDFNNWSRDFLFETGKSLTDGTTYYVRAQLMNNDNPVATSDVIEVVGVVNE